MREKFDKKEGIEHGEAVTTETFLTWRERFEAEQALARAKLMPDSSLTAPKKKRLTKQQYFQGFFCIKNP